MGRCIGQEHVYIRGDVLARRRAEAKTSGDR